MTREEALSVTSLLLREVPWVYTRPVVMLVKPDLPMSHMYYAPMDALLMTEEFYHRLMAVAMFHPEMLGSEVKHGASTAARPTPSPSPRFADEDFRDLQEHYPFVESVYVDGDTVYVVARGQEKDGVWAIDCAGLTLLQARREVEARINITPVY